MRRESFGKRSLAIPPTDSDEDSGSPMAAMYGLAASIPLSILLWATVGVMFWLWSRRG
jgi:hypothetical protein